MAAIGAETISHGTVVVEEATGEMEMAEVSAAITVADSVTMVEDSEIMAEEIGETVTAAATEMVAAVVSAAVQ